MLIRGGALLILGCLLLPSARAAAVPQKLPGLWGSENVDPQVSGTLTIDGRRSPWRATIAGFDAGVSLAGSRIAFSLPGNQGTFRGALDPDGRGIRGQWIQPPGAIDNNAEATPVTLASIGEHVWQGAVVPLQGRLTLYLLISKGKNGSLTAFLRNPEFNLGRRGAYSVTATKSGWSFVNSRDASDRMQATVDPAAKHLVVMSSTPGGPFTFTLRDRNHALGFYPDTPAGEALDFLPPVAEDDGWSTGSLQSVGLDPRPLEALLRKILRTPYEGPHTPYVHSLLIARHGKLVLERYFHGTDREGTHNMRSASKTFTGVLLGIALDHGARLTLDTPVLSLFPQYKTIANLDARKRAMRVRDLLTMTSGLSCDDDDDASPGNENTMQQQTTQPDWYKYTLDLPMAAAPGGTKAVYCSAGVNLLGGAIRNATGMNLPELFARDYAGPMDCGLYHMNLMPQGEAYMAGGMNMRPRDQLKLGQLYLDGGVWRGRRVVSAAWVKASWQPSSRFEAGHAYGYGWHIVDLPSGGKEYRLYEAGGNGGQFVIAIPQLDLVVGFTAGNYGDFGTWYKLMTDWVPAYVIPAAAGSGG